MLDQRKSLAIAKQFINEGKYFLSFRIMRCISLICCVAASAASSFITVAAPESEGIAEPAIVPIEVFAKLPAISDAKLSPSGDRLAYFAEINGQRELVISAINGENPLLVTAPDKQSFTDFLWKSDTTLLYTTNYTVKRRSRKLVSSESRAYRLDLTANQTLWLGAPNRANFQETEGQYETILYAIPDDPDHILIELDLNRNNQYEVYQVNLASGHRKLYQREQSGVQDWQADLSGTLRLASGVRGKQRIARLLMPDGDWADLEDMPWATQYQIQGFTKEPHIVYVSGYNKYGLRSLYTLDITTGSVLETVFSHADVDMDGVIADPLTREIIGVTYTDNFQRIQYFGAALATIQRSIDLAMPDTVNTILGGGRGLKQLYLVLATNDRNPGDYYIYNSNEGTLIFTSPSRPMVFTAQMSSTKAVKIPVSDGSVITAYMTIPNRVSASAHLPAIILPHGGPYGVRDTAAWDYEAQFYANRGYLVLKPNFRGSYGYGLTYAQAGYKQWGGRMQDDVTDATKWLISQGYADPDRICIVGSSYGGYAALMGAITQPSLYQCAVSVNGITDLLRLKSSDNIYSINGRNWTNRWGLEGAKDKTVSPYHRAQDITIPVMLMASINDARVPFKLSQDMHEKLLKLGKKNRHVRIEHDTHNMITEAARLTMLTEIEAFLETHIGATTSP